MADTYASLQISATRHGGYVVWPSDVARGEYREPLFAGPLQEALEFMQRAIRDNQPTGEA